MAEVGAVKVAVRVRPMNSREIAKNSKPIIQMKGKQTRIVNGRNEEDSRDFTFDFSYDSIDSNDPNYASQEQVFEDLGTDVINSAFDGYNACLFAYGQTGSGKSYSMMGYDEDSKGLIPRICEGLFSRVATCKNGTKFSAHVSYLEIYNEKVKDLLATSGKAKDTHSLKVREHPKSGPFVEGLSVHEVCDFPGIAELMERGNDSRTVAATNMNDTSSRSHAVFTLTFAQASFVEGVPAEKSSKLNLVDLAGSERTSSTGATGTRLVEGGNINKSLTTLGLVISALADRSSAEASGSKSKKSSFVPYRDSVLTWLLRESLGGNSKTIMLAAISPADVNHGETLSTLHYANRAKNIVNKPMVNEDENVRLIRELRGEIDRLKQFLGGEEEVARLQAEADAAKIRLANATTDEEKAEALKEVEQTEKLLGSAGDKALIAQQIEQSQKMMSALTGQWENKWTSQTQIMEDRSLDLKSSGRAVHIESQQPHLVSLNLDDPLATGVVLYYLHEGITTLGCSGSEPTPDIELWGSDAADQHCTIDYDGQEQVFLTPLGGDCLLNGKKLSGKTELAQGNSLQLGRDNIFRFNHPLQAAKLKKLRQARRESSGALLISGGATASATPLESGSPTFSPGHILEQNREQDEQAAHAAQARLEELERLQAEREAEHQSLKEAIAAQEAARISEEERKQQEQAERLRQLEEMLAEKDEQLQKVQSMEEQARVAAAEELAMERTHLEAARKEAEEKAAELARLALEAKENSLEEERQRQAIHAQKMTELAEAEEKERQEQVQLAAQRVLEMERERQEMMEKLRAAEERFADSEREKQQTREQFEEMAAKAEAEQKLRAQLEVEHENVRQQAELAGGGTGQETAEQPRKVAGPVASTNASRDDAPFHEVWEIKIPRAHTRGDPASGNSYVVYELRLCLHGESWKIFRRYREFDQLHTDLKRKCPGVVNFVKFPAKKLWPNAQFLKQRRGDLEAYMNELVSLLHGAPNSPFYKTRRANLMKILPFFRPGEGLHR